MKRIVMTMTILLVACAYLALPSFAQTTPAKKAGPLTGTWKCIGKIPDRPDGEFQLDLEQNGEDVKGSGSNAQGSAPLKGTFKDGKFKLTVEAGDVTYEFEGQLENDKIKGKFAVPVASIQGTFEGSKEGAAAATLTGVWTVTVKHPDHPDAEGQLDLEQKGEDVKGTGSNAGGSAPVTGTVKEGKFKLKVESGDAPWDIDGQLDGDKLKGNWAIPAVGAKGTFEATRKKS